MYICGQLETNDKFDIMKNKKFFPLILLSLLMRNGVSLHAQELQVHYQASDTLNALTLNDCSGNGHTAKVVNKTALKGKFEILNGETAFTFGSGRTCIDMGETFGNVVAELKDYTVAMRLFINKNNYLDNPLYGSCFWSFSKSMYVDQNSNGYLAFSGAGLKYSISRTGEQDSRVMSSFNSHLEIGRWVWLVFVQKDGVARLFVDGELVGNETVQITPEEIGKTGFNYLGYPPFTEQEKKTYAKGISFSEFRLYKGTLSMEQIGALSKTDYTPAQLKSRFTFKKNEDDLGVIKGRLYGSAQLGTIGTQPVLQLGDTKGYFDFGPDMGNVINGLKDFTIASNVYIPGETELDSNGNFIFNFAKSSSTGYLFLGANTTKYAISRTNWSGEDRLDCGVAFPRGCFKHLVYRQKKGVGQIFLDGLLVKTDSILLNPEDVGNTTLNYLGRSCYDGDSYLKGAIYSDFRIYEGGLDELSIQELTSNLEELNLIVYQEYVRKAQETLSLAQTEGLLRDLKLPLLGDNGVSIAWHSDDETVIEHNGKIHRPAIGKPASETILTATLTCGRVLAKKEFKISVCPFQNDEQSVLTDLEELKLGDDIYNLRTQLYLPANTLEGSIIRWKSDSPDYLNDAGKVLKRSPYGEGKRRVVLTATAMKGNCRASREFTVYLAEEEPYTNYLFTFFPSNSNENMYYALSSDGFNYTVLNNGKRVLASDSIALKRAIRDPHILRGQDGKTFYMVMTDMKSSEGWSSNRGIVLLKSTDLVNWQHNTVHFPTRFSTEWSNVTRVWAPEVIWDSNYENSDGTKGRYMVYFSLLTNDGKCPYDRVYYAYANDDFSDLMTEPVFLYDRGSATIDANIVFNEKDSLYHMFYKNEGQGGICKVTSSILTATDGNPGSQWSKPTGNLQQTNVAVEGVGVFRKINEEDWVMMYDCYGSGYYQFCSSSNLETFKLEAQTATSGAFTPRHGTVIPVTAQEVETLMKAFPTAGLNAKPQGVRSHCIKQEDVVIDHDAKMILIPVSPGTDISDFDPLLYASAGTQVTPQGKQDFSNGGLKYSFRNTGETVDYTVKVEVYGNPVIGGFYADPEILYSHKTGKFYLYPTTDGITGWGGYTFSVFSSPDLVNWQNEGVMLDVKSDDVLWASGNAWAPCIQERKTIDGYKYYFYFSAHHIALNKKTLGVAVSDTPTGPFKAVNEPLVTEMPAAGQIIDSDVFTDPISGETYYYWGNGSLIASCMSEDQMGYSSPKVITPLGGSLADYAFREAPYVFYRNGLYYFLWSVDDTGSANYHVAYGTSTSPLGPIKIATKPVILIQDPEQEIYGTGHNAVIQIPGKDEWYMVYHRINKKFKNNGPGYHREVCIDKMEFNTDGTIKLVKPTRKGIDPVDMSEYIEDILTNATPPVISDADEKEVLRSIYYTIEGVNLGSKHPQKKGIYLKADIMKSGKVKVSKWSK